MDNVLKDNVECFYGCKYLDCIWRFYLMSSGVYMLSIIRIMLLQDTC